MLKNFFKVKYCLKNQGMTLVELMVVLAIFMIITGLVIFDYGSFRSSTSTQNLANDIALSVRKAQSYAIGVRGVGTNFLIRHGIHFSTDTDNSEPSAGSNKSFVLFTDNNVDNKYNIGECTTPSVSECQEILTINGADEISGFYLNSYQGTLRKGTLDIFFERPNPDAKFCFIEEGTSSCASGFSYVTIEISNGRIEEGEKIIRKITIWSTGQIGANQNN
jgi:prepilin-type N-terminal cleavage/methylation domain-containing protein